MEQFCATCPRGLEQLLAEELQQLKAETIHAVGGGVEFSGDFPLCYRANLESRIKAHAAFQRRPRMPAVRVQDGGRGNEGKKA